MAAATASAECTLLRIKQGPRLEFKHKDTGESVTDAEQLRRLRAIRVPEYWTDVLCSTNPEAAIQAKGKDANKRTQYVYHDEHLARKEEARKRAASEFVEALPTLRARLRRELTSGGLTAGRDARFATCAALLTLCHGFFDVPAKRTPNGDESLLSCTPDRFRFGHTKRHRSATIYQNGVGVEIVGDTPDAADLVNALSALHLAAVAMGGEGGGETAPVFGWNDGGAKGWRGVTHKDLTRVLGELHPEAKLTFFRSFHGNLNLLHSMGKCVSECEASGTVILCDRDKGEGKDAGVGARSGKAKAKGGKGTVRASTLLTTAIKQAAQSVNTQIPLFKQRYLCPRFAERFVKDPSGYVRQLRLVPPREIHQAIATALLGEVKGGAAS